MGIKWVLRGAGEGCRYSDMDEWWLVKFGENKNQKNEIDKIEKIKLISQERFTKFIIIMEMMYNHDYICIIVF